MNIQFAHSILQQLADQGVKTLCLCPGARNAAFIEIASRQNFFEVIGFYDERSAGFFALGRARRDNKPVAVLTTSGTAVSELLSPVIEAYYSNVPLVVLSSDRPKRLRGTGAPQTIDQTQIFNGYVERVWDLEIHDSVDLSFSNTKPVHINACFDEPLVQGELSEFSFTEENEQSGDESPDNWDLNPISLERPLIIVGGLQNKDQESVINFLNEQNCPFYLEALSGLRKDPCLRNSGFQAGEKIVSKLLKSGEVQSVLRIGDIPVGRYWRDLDSLSIETVSISEKAFGGTEKSKLYHCSLSAIDQFPITLESWDWSSWENLDADMKSKVDDLLKQEDFSEIGVFNKLVSMIEEKDDVYLGNSMPIRHWDLISQSRSRSFASRGANGIDGQLSTALGLSSPNSTMWVFLGDLTALYDFSGFWVSKHLKAQNIQINLVIINNFGGQIFDRIFQNPLFKNEHDLSFRSFAKMWNWNYFDQIPTKVPQGLNLIEVRIEAEKSKNFWEAYDRL